MKDKEKNAEYQRKWYQKNKDIQKQRVQDRRKALRQWLKEYKKELRCNRCNEDFWAALDFHHPDGLAENDVRISKVIDSKGWGKERIIDAINDCEVLCANCHRKEHWSDET